MGWPLRSAVETKLEFVVAAQEGRFTMTELCASYGIARKTGYKWLCRYVQSGLEGLNERSRAPRRRPLKTPAEVEELIVEMRDAHPTWGAAKLKAALERDRPELAVPARSTVHDILKRHKRVRRRRRRRKRAPSPAPSLGATQPNDVWCTDFKGEFRTQDGVYCYPLTVSDHSSRYLLACHGLLGTESAGSRRVFERLFDTHGVPSAILSDNGVPFSGPNALCRLSPLAVWWMQLGIRLVRTQPGHPEQNGRHERMHRTLKAETTRPPGRHLQDQQVRFDHFRQEYNSVRPHQALDFDVPSDLYTPSTQSHRIQPFTYPGHFEIRKVGGSGHFKLNAKDYFLTSTLAREHIGLEQIDYDVWSIYYRNFLLGRLNEHQARIDEVGPTPVLVNSEKVLPMYQD